MKQGRFSNEQIVRILRETDQDSVAVVAKRHGVSDATIYIWRKKFGQLDTDEVKRLKALEAENARLKKLLVDRDLEIEVMKEINAKNGERTRPPLAQSTLHCVADLFQPGLLSASNMFEGLLVVSNQDS